MKVGRLLTIGAFVVFITVSGVTSFSQDNSTTAKADIIKSLTLGFQGGYLFGNQAGYGIDGGFAPISYDVVTGLPHRSDDPGRDIGTTWGGAQAKVLLAYSIKQPFMVGNGPLFSTNNIEYGVGVDLSPVSTNLLAHVTLTPLALLKFSVGGSLGTGWYFLFNGLGRNLSGSDYAAPQREPFSGAVYSLWSSLTLQFDFGAVFPGKWNHVVMAFVPKVEYKAFSGADADTPWQYEADSGENFNGLKLYTTTFLGYQMPLVVDTVGLLVGTEQYIDSNKDRSPVASGGWGSDFVFVTFGPLANIRLNKKSSLTVLLQFKNGRDYTDDTIGNRFFEYRSYQYTYYYLYRLAFSYSLKLK